MTSYSFYGVLLVLILLLNRFTFRLSTSNKPSLRFSSAISPIPEFLVWSIFLITLNASYGIPPISWHLLKHGEQSTKNGRPHTTLYSRKLCPLSYSFSSDAQHFVIFFYQLLLARGDCMMAFLSSVY